MKKVRPHAFRLRHSRQQGPKPGPPQPSRVGGRAVTPEGPARRRKTVLVVEDSATFGGLLVGLLKQEGYQAVRAWNDREAAKMARDRRPDLVMVDLSLPYPERVELVDALLQAEELAAKPVVVVSSHPLPFLKDTPRIEAVVTKPFDIDRMLNAVRKGLGEPELEVPEKQYSPQDYHLNAW